MDTETLTQESRSLSNVDAAQPHLVLLLERLRPLSGSARHSIAHIDRITIGRGRTRTARRTVEGGVRTLAISVPDLRMSATHATLERRGEDWTFLDHGSTNGSRIAGVRATAAALADGDLLELAGTFFRFRSTLRTPATSLGDVDSAQLEGLVARFGTILPWLARDLEQLAHIARANVSVLLLGESGTGKEVLARAIHEHSRRPGPFVPVNCGALPAGLVESMLFGHKRGAFSGATSDEIGLVRAAQGGTLFLDEVGDLPRASQSALLRVLQEREVMPLGATRSLTADARVVAATHRPLAELVASGEFRGDLFARLNVFSFHLPPLRERADDLGVLFGAVLAEAAGPRARSVALGSDAAYALFAHAWPNNVRELQHCVSVSAALAKGERLDRVYLPQAPEAAASPCTPAQSVEDEALRAEIIASLQANDGNVTRVGEAMGKPRTQVQRWLKRLAIDARAFRSSADGRSTRPPR